MTLTPGALCLFDVAPTVRVLARYLGVRLIGEDEGISIMYTAGDGKGHVWPVIRNSVLRKQVQPLDEFFRQRALKRLREKGH